MSVWSYEGKKVVVTGCYSGIGSATAQELVRLGAEVHGLDVREPTTALASFQTCDLREPATIDACVERLPASVDALFGCAGLPQTFPAIDVMRVNFIGMRHLTEQVLERMSEGAAIATVASTAANRYVERIDRTLELVATKGADAAEAWCEENPEVVDTGYIFSKEAVVVWTMRQAPGLIERGIRINCVSPGPTATPMASHFEQAMGTDLWEAYPRPIGRDSRPEEQANALAFLNSDAATYISGHNLIADGGLAAGVATGAIDMSEVQRLARQRSTSS